MPYLLIALGSLVLTAAASFCLNRFARLANAVGAAGAVIACIAAFPVFCAGNRGASLSVSLPWPVPFGSFSLCLDSVGRVFLLPVFILCAAAAVYGFEYLKHYYGKKNIGTAWFFYNLLAAGMILVVLARNALLFLVAWEIMSVSSFFLVLFEGEKKETVRAGILYLVATHIGTLFLLVMFVLLGQGSGSFDFADWKTSPGGFLPSAVFLCALIGFGTKAGFMPLHIWLPEAHPAAPSHVSAVMSAVMIKTGIYGIVRVLTFLGVPPAWWGYTLIGIGIVSGILGILFALAQHDLKRLLAYSSIENVGIISIGLGLGIVGMSSADPALAAIGFAAALLHVINHAFFKGLLFLGAGVLAQETGTREIDILGGLLKKMPVTGFCFLIGAAAICGLPPLNGFISEFLIYFAAFKGIFNPALAVLVFLGVIVSLALIGSLAVACFAKAFGIIFLGEPRSGHGDKAREPGPCMRLPLVLLAGLCVLLAGAAPFIPRMFAGAIFVITGIPADQLQAHLSGSVGPLSRIVFAALLFGSFFAVALLLRLWLLRTRDVRSVVTWDCGYARPQSRMQYTASSFVQPTVDFFKGILRTNKSAHRIDDYFPGSFTYKTKTADLFSEGFFRPVLESIRRIAGKLTWVQHGQLQVYVLYILITLMALFIWKFR